MDVTMGNPHMQEVEMAYLAGLIDGEGTITLERSGNRRLNGMMGLSPKVIVTDTDRAIVDATMTIMRRLGVNPYVKVQSPAKRKKACFWVTVSGLSKCKKVLEAVKPYLVGKLAQAQLVLDFVESRGNSQAAKGQQYSEAELQILDKLRALNHRGVSETEDHGLRWKLASKSQMTVHSAVKAAG